MTWGAAHSTFFALRHRLARRLTPTLLSFLTLLLALAGMTAGYRWSERSGMAQLATAASERLELYAGALEAELARYAYLPSLIAVDGDVAALLDAPADARLRERAGRAVTRIGARAGSVLIFITDSRGGLLAASSRSPRQAAATRHVPGEVAAALARGAASFFAANPADGTTDHYVVHEVQRGGATVGHIVVKISLAALEATWVDLGIRTESEKLLVVDDDDHIIMSSVPAWKNRLYTTTAGRALRPDEPEGPRPLNLLIDGPVGPGALLVRAGEQSGARYPVQLAQERPIVPLAVRLVALSDPSQVWRSAREAALGGAALGALTGVLLLYLLHRWKAVQALFQASSELQQAHDQLERRVEQRTRQLRRANQELRHQIAQRLQIEDELVQAGKMAVLGQMSAGISHEINQPLTALRALSRNTLRLLEAGRMAVVADNLRAIDEMTERAGRIVTQLKSFARKSAVAEAPVDLSSAVRNVLLMLDHRLRHEHIEVTVEVPAPTWVRGDITRLEQVLLNLVSNALDAMAGAEPRRLAIRARRAEDADEERWAVQVEDSGPGVPPQHLPRLFEPFFTTKPAGQGLGLGLSISAMIVRELGGSLSAEPGAAGGMRFKFDLEPAENLVHV